MAPKPKYKPNPLETPAKPRVEDTAPTHPRPPVEPLLEPTPVSLPILSQSVVIRSANDGLTDEVCAEYPHRVLCGSDRISRLTEKGYVQIANVVGFNDKPLALMGKRKESR